MPPSDVRTTRAQTLVLFAKGAAVLIVEGSRGPAEALRGDWRAAHERRPVAVMGIYLLVDQLFLPGKPLVTFRAGGVQLEITLRSEKVPADVYTFVNRVFELKDDNGPNGVFARIQRFAPR